MNNLVLVYTIMYEQLQCTLGPQHLTLPLIECSKLHQHIGPVIILVALSILTHVCMYLHVHVTFGCSLKTMYVPLNWST